MASPKPTKTSKAKRGTPKASKAKPTASNKPKTSVSALSSNNSWLQDVTLEVPVPPSQTFIPGSRELEFSIGMRQQEHEGFIRSELRGRALVHIQGQVLALAEASYVHVAPQISLPEDLPQQLYEHLRPQLERILAQGGHTPPLPASLDKIA